MLVSEILSKHDIHLPLTQNLFELDFEGSFDEYLIEETEWGTVYICFDEHYAIRINPTSPETCLGYMQHWNKKSYGSVSIYDINGTFIANAKCLPRTF